MSNYLSGSPFGQVAGSLLSQKNRRNRKQRNQALILAALFEAFGVRQKQQFETKKENINELNDQYGDIIEINKANYNDPSAVKERNLYKQWLNEDTKNSAINAKAIDYFNSMPALTEQFGPNAYAAVQQLSLTTNDAKIQAKFAEDMALAKEYAKQYFTNIETDETGQYRVIKTPNIVEFNADVKRAYKAALNEVKNDPTKKGVIREFFVKTFGRDKEGNPRFGMIHQDNLTNERERLEKEAGITRTETDFGYNLSLGIYTDDILDNTINSADSEEGEERTWLTWSSTDKAAGTSDDNTTANVKGAFGKYPIPIKGDASPIGSHVTELNYFLNTGVKEKDEAERAKTHLTANKNDGKYMMEVDGEETNIYDYYKNLPSGDAKLVFMDDILTRSRKLQQAYESGGGTEVKSPAHFVDLALLDYIENKHVGIRDKEAVLNIDLNEIVNVNFNGKALEAPIGELINKISTFDSQEDARAYIDAFDGLSETHQNYFEVTYDDFYAPSSDNKVIKFGPFVFPQENIVKGIGDIVSQTVGRESTMQKNADIKLLVKYMEGAKVNPVRLKAVLERHNLDEDKNIVKQFLTEEGVEFNSGSGLPF
tara:strand:+ start:3327 stop:5117 length:1791 start_codon:yes stop_codon:yes gene_type:complete